jgi:hypothetical protein
LRRLAFFLLFFSFPVQATTYFISPTGNDANNGLSAGAPWLSPNHAVNCGDIITAASGSYDGANFANGKWGTVTCAAGNNVAWLTCPVFDACKVSSATTSGIEISASYWGVQGWEATTTGSNTFGECFGAKPPTSAASIHHIVYANNVANGCQAGGFTFYSNGAASEDYVAIVGNIAYNTAQSNQFCYSGISIASPTSSDSLPGTHILVAGNLSYLNVEPNPCNGGAPTDGDGGIFDSWNTNTYTQQGVMENNIFLSNGGRGLEFLRNGTTGSHANLYSNHNTTWNNSTDNNQNVGDCGELYFAFGVSMESSRDLAVTNSSTGCNGHNLYAYIADTIDSSAHWYQGWGYSAAGNNTLIGSSDGFASGPNMTFSNPNLAAPATPSAPSCGSSSSVPNCMATVIANFAPQNAAAKSYGYQIPNGSTGYDPLFPQWLCNVNLPAGLINLPCSTASTAITPGAQLNPGTQIH